MGSLPLMRTEYWNVSTNTVRGGATGHGESLVDVESFVLPQAQMQGSSLFSWGVAEGLTVGVAAGQSGLVIAPGVALDVAGHLIALAAGGFAVVDPTVDPHQVQNIPTVPVDPSGVVLGTAGASGACVLTLTWREVLGQSQLANAPALIHAPWLRLLSVAGFADTGEQVVLARVTLDDNGLVTALSAEGRRLVGVPAERLELRRVRAVAAPAPSVDHLPAGELRARGDGGLELNLLPPTGPAWPALAVGGTPGSLLLAPQGGNVGIGTAAPAAGLDIDRGAGNDPALRVSSSGPGLGSGVVLSNTAPGGRTYGSYSGNDGKWHFADQTAQTDRLVIDQSGNLGLGIGAGQAQRTLHVEGNEVHSGGPGGGFSFMNRGTPGFVDLPGAGERWVWYAMGGSARLWSSGDKLTITPAGSVGVGTTTPSHPLHVLGVKGIRQNELYLSGGPGWSSLSYNAHHNPENSNWVFPNPARPAVTIEMDDAGGVPRFQVWSTTKENTTGWNLRLSIDGQSGVVTIPSLSVGKVRGILSVDNDDGQNATFAAANHKGNAICATTDAGTAVVAVSNSMAFSALGPSSFNGNVDIHGTLTATGKNFVIDHPLDPENKYLVHTSIESSERANIYSGNVILDDNGEARVRLPDWVEALNTDFRYQLTCVGEAAPVHIAQEVSEGTFVIAGGTSGMKVSWQLTGVRDDPWARENQLVVEEEKPDSEKGFFEHPDVFGRDLTSSVHYLRNEELIRRNPRIARRMIQRLQTEGKSTPDREE